MTHAYRKTYLNKAARNFGNMMAFAVNDCAIDGCRYLQMFISSGLALQFEHGNPKVIAGMSGIDLATEAITLATGNAPKAVPSVTDYRTSEYWGGWALAQYQWYTARRFSSILRFMPFSEILNMYYTLHEADITEFYAAADEIYKSTRPQTGLKRIRETVGLSQSKLAAEAGVSLRTIQMFEQRSKDINKAQAITVVKIARALGCEAGDLME